jgi:hypothetical protein
MPDIYGVTPTFAAGQVLSASAHLNPLQEYIQAIRDDITGSAMPFLAWYPYGDVPVSKYWKGALRHKKNSLSYNYVILDGGGDCQIKIDGVSVPGSLHNGPGTYSASNVDISTMLLTTNEFYDVEFTIANEGSVEGKAYPLFICESYTPSVYTPASFADSTVPTASQWNVLSAYAAEMANAASVPQPCPFLVKGRYKHFLGLVNHHARYLAYSFSLTPPYHTEGSWVEDNWVLQPGGEWINYPITHEAGDQWAEISIRINGALALRCRAGTPSSTSSGEDYYGNTDLGTATFTGLLDLDTYPGSLTVGTDYVLEFSASGEGTSFGSQDNDTLFYLYEIPEENPTLTGWTAFVPWAHGNYVYGNSSAPQVVVIADNLDLLAATINYHNFPAPNDAGAGLNGFRRWRYLHYRTEEDAEPVLIYTYKGKETRISLDEAFTAWGFVDLDSIEGLYAGSQYRLEAVRTALEDVEA